MLRRIAGPGRAPGEEWVKWIQRSTRAARQAAKDAKIRFWLEAHLRSKWCWAGHVIRMTPDRLARRALVWRGSLWQAEEVANFPASLRIRRPWRTQWFRWEDELRRFAQHFGYASWQEVAQRRDVAGKASEWLAACNEFVRFSK